MEGMKFLIVGPEGPINHGSIVQRITAEKYLCQFARTPVSCRVCDLEEIQNWNLFPNDQLMNEFILEIGKQKAPPAPPGTGEVDLPPDTLPPDTLPPVKKKVAKKKAKRKAPLQGAENGA